MPLLHFFSGIKKNFKRYKTARGFSLLELLVVLSIAIIITTVVLLDYPLFGANQALNISVQETAQAIREAQLYGISVKQSTDCPSGPSSCKYPAYGLYFEGSGTPIDYSENIIIFADSDNNGYYSPPSAPSPGTDKIDRILTISPPSFIHTICYSNDNGKTYVGQNCTGGSITKVNVVYRRPNPEPIIEVVSNNSTIKGIKLIKINIRGPSGDQDVFIGNYGQVSVGGFNKPAEDASCPFVSSWNGSEYVFEYQGVTSPFNIFRHLAYAQSKNKEVPVKIEDIFDYTKINSFNAYVAEIKDDYNGTDMLQDTDGKIRTINHFDSLEKPLSCQDEKQNDCLNSITNNDNFTAKIGPLGTNPDSINSRLELTFKKPKTIEDGKLILNLAQNPGIKLATNKLREKLGALVPFVFNHPESVLVRSFFDKKSFTDALSLQLEYMDGDGFWRKAAVMFPQGDRQNQKYVVPLDGLAADSDKISIRLSSGGWYDIDSARLDWSADLPITITPLTLSRVLSSRPDANNNETFSSVLNADDKAYDLETGESLEFFFKDIPEKENTKRAYFSRFQGSYTLSGEMPIILPSQLKEAALVKKAIQEGPKAVSRMIGVYNSLW